MPPKRSSQHTEDLRDEFRRNRELTGREILRDESLIRTVKAAIVEYRKLINAAVVGSINEEGVSANAGEALHALKLLEFFLTNQTQDSQGREVPWIDTLPSRTENRFQDTKGSNVAKISYGMASNSQNAEIIRMELRASVSDIAAAEEADLSASYRQSADQVYLNSKRAMPNQVSVSMGIYTRNEGDHLLTPKVVTGIGISYDEMGNVVDVFGTRRESGVDHRTFDSLNIPVSEPLDSNLMQRVGLFVS